MVDGGLALVDGLRRLGKAAVLDDRLQHTPLFQGCFVHRRVRCPKISNIMGVILQYSFHFYEA
jgi:hypothetical protein